MNVKLCYDLDAYIRDLAAQEAYNQANPIGLPVQIDNDDADSVFVPTSFFVSDAQNGTTATVELPVTPVTPKQVHKGRKPSKTAQGLT